MKKNTSNTYANKLLNRFRKTVSLGFSDDNFKKAGVTFQKLQRHLSLQEYHQLGDAWRNVYISPNSLDELNKICKHIALRFKQQ